MGPTNFVGVLSVLFSKANMNEKLDLLFNVLYKYRIHLERTFQVYGSARTLVTILSDGVISGDMIIQAFQCACACVVRPIFLQGGDRSATLVCYIRSQCYRLQCFQCCQLLCCREEPEGRPGGPERDENIRGVPLAPLPLPGPPGIPSGSSLGSLELPQATLS